VTDYLWWEEVAAAAPLMQGDLIEGCPVAVFGEELKFDEAADLDGLLQTLTGGVGIQRVRSIVMTQACDLEQAKVRNVILCPAYTLEDFEKEWRDDFAARKGKPPTPGDWNGYIGQVKAGRIWNLTLLRKRDPGDGVTTVATTTVVDFHEVFSLPLKFMQAWVQKSAQPRLRLCPPYREHLSQAFARFFMRVGLPVDIGDL
jgi:hypothetical protein